MSSVPGTGLARGLAVTLRTLMKPSVTQQYPHVPPELPPRSRGVIALLEENCTVCMLCARECPDWCIYIDSHKEVVPAKEEGARPRTRNILDRFAIDYALCMYCGICVEVCPFDALFWSPEFEYATYDVLGLTHEKERLRDWMATVPPPPATEVSADQGKELETVLKAAERPERPERPPRAERPERPERSAGTAPTADLGAADVTQPAADVAPPARQGGEPDAATAPDDGGAA